MLLPDYLYAVPAILLFEMSGTKSVKTVSTNHSFLTEREREEKKKKKKSNLGPSASKPSALPLRQSGLWLGNRELQYICIVVQEKRAEVGRGE